MALMLTTLVSAVPPVTTTVGTEYLEIFYPQFELVPQYSNFTLHSHVVNTTGVVIPGEASCLLHIYLPTGSHVLETPIGADGNGIEWDIDIDGGNFSTLGTHAFYIECNTTNQIGAVHGTFDVTDKTYYPTVADAIMYSLLLGLMVLLAMLCYGFAVSIDGKNEFQLGKLVKINYNKYIKQGLFFMGYLFTIFTVFFASQISNNFLKLLWFTTILNWLHIVLWIAFFPIFIIFVYFSIVKWLMDLELERLNDRGLKPYGS